MKINEKKVQLILEINKINYIFVKVNIINKFKTKRKMIIKVDAEAKKLLLEMLDVVVRSQGLKAAELGTQFPKLIQLIDEPVSKPSLEQMAKINATIQPDVEDAEVITK